VIRALRPIIALILLSACGSVPVTHYYTLAPAPAKQLSTRGSAVLSIDELSVASAYTDQRIAYRPAPYRLEYYDYHQWAAPLSMALTDYLRDALSESGRFQQVATERRSATTLVLGGRLAAFEEVDVTPQHWVGRVDIELFLEEPRSGKVVWSRRFREQQDLKTRDPAGLAEALSAALSRIVTQAVPEIWSTVDRAERVREMQAARSGD